jgi:uncharacterized protein (TIGR03435 family)
MIGAVTNHLWQSTLFAVAAGLLTVALRKNRAHVRFWLWFGASVKFFVPFAVPMSFGSRLEWAPARKIAIQIAAPAVSIAMEQIAQPFATTVPIAPTTRGTGDWIPIAILAVWASGFAAIALFRFRVWLRIRAALRGADTRVCRVEIRLDAFRPARQIWDGEAFSIPVEIRFSPGLLEPGVVGIRRPILLLPEGIEDRLTPPQLEAVLAHELCHIRRRDNLFASIHMIVEAVFWFHPLVWWIGARLVEERERACDIEVLRLGSEPHVYAEGILNVCKLYVESPLVCVSGVTGADLKKRIEAIMTNCIVLKLNLAKKAALAFACIAALAMPIIVGMMRAPVTRAQSASAPTAKFEVTSVKPCKDSAPDAGRKGGGGGGPAASPGRLALPCRTTMDLIRAAYVQFANGKFNPVRRHVQIEGGPSWIDSDRYQIEAKAEGAPGGEMMRGALLQALLEDRFKLKIRRETREVPVYALSVGKVVPKLQAAKEGGCIPLDMNHPPPPPEPGKPFPWLCGLLGRRPDAIEIHHTTMENLSEQFSILLDRDVINKTGIAGLFDIRVEVTPDELSAGPSDTTPPANQDYETGLIFAAIRKLGFKLESAKGPGQFLVIDHVERPTEN